MCVVKTDGHNRLNEENLTYLLQVKVDGPTIEDFMQTPEAKLCPYGIMIKTIECTSHYGNHIQRDKTKKQNHKILTWQVSDSSSDNNDVDFD